MAPVYLLTHFAHSIAASWYNNLRSVTTTKGNNKAYVIFAFKTASVYKFRNKCFCYEISRNK